MRKALPAAGLLLMISLAGNALQWRKYTELAQRVPYSERDRDIVAAAIRMYALEVKQPPETALGDRFPVVTVTKEQRCVNFMAPRGAIGWLPVYCFDWEGKLIRKERI